MRKQGTIRRWDAERGFGFIDSGDSRDVFVHIRDFARSGISPVAGMQITYEEIQVGGKGPRAMDVRLAGRNSSLASPSFPATSNTSQPSQNSRPRPQTGERPGTSSSRPSSRRQSAPATGKSLFKMLLLIWVALLVFGAYSGRLPLSLFGVVLLLNLATYFVYSWDKSAAEKGHWRTAEKTLHMLALAGGWPAAWWAQQKLRHKSSKHEFRVMYWITVIGNCVLLAAYVLMPQLWTGMFARVV